MDGLISLWYGVLLHLAGTVVRAALLGVSCDMPALRKVSQILGHKADLGCSHCTFMAEREPSTRGTSGKMSYFTQSEASGRTMEQVRIQAKEYQSAQKPKPIQKKNGVRYTELLRLEYFDIIRMMITDPMHTFLLETVHNEVKLCLSSMSANNATEFTLKEYEFHVILEGCQQYIQQIRWTDRTNSATVEELSLHLCSTMLRWIDIRQSIPINALTVSNC